MTKRALNYDAKVLEYYKNAASEKVFDYIYEGTEYMTNVEEEEAPPNSDSDS